MRRRPSGAERRPSGAERRPSKPKGGLAGLKGGLAAQKRPSGAFVKDAGAGGKLRRFARKRLHCEPQGSPWPPRATSNVIHREPQGYPWSSRATSSLIHREPQGSPWSSRATSNLFYSEPQGSPWSSRPTSIPGGACAALGEVACPVVRAHVRVCTHARRKGQGGQAGISCLTGARRKGKGFANAVAHRVSSQGSGVATRSAITPPRLPLPHLRGHTQLKRAWRLRPFQTTCTMANSGRLHPWASMAACPVGRVVPAVKAIGKVPLGRSCRGGCPRLQNAWAVRVRTVRTQRRSTQKSEGSAKGCHGQPGLGAPVSPNECIPRHLPWHGCR
jgi:hypothetical protein